jgi:6-phosphogluconolactonase (cycloisomerase 2 family)
MGILEIDQATGSVKLIGSEWTRGDYPRHMTIDPTGQFMYVLNQRSDNIATFRIEGGGSKLTFVGTFSPIGNPMRMLFFNAS